MDERRERQKLRKAERLRKTREIDRLFREGSIVRGPNFRLLYLSRGGSATRSARAAFVAGKRIGKSVARSRIKRLLREAFRRIKAELKTEPIDLVFVANRDFAAARAVEVADEMRVLLERAGLVSARPPRQEGTRP
ncbi:MAG: ribonuclease P protein component [Candidatus Eisenbacteria bacterium]|nr:ribonuclease P protein component [Candidatus Eisenbacteria bacterium]